MKSPHARQAGPLVQILKLMEKLDDERPAVHADIVAPVRLEIFCDCSGYLTRGDDALEEFVDLAEALTKIKKLARK